MIDEKIALGLASVRRRENIRCLGGLVGDEQRRAEDADNAFIRQGTFGILIFKWRLGDNVRQRIEIA